MSSAPSGMVVEGPAGRVHWTLHVLGWHKPFSVFYRNKLSFSLESEQKSSNTFKSVPHLWAGRQITTEECLALKLLEKILSSCHSLCVEPKITLLFRVSLITLIFFFNLK